MRRYAKLTLLLTLLWSAVAVIYAHMLAPMARMTHPHLDLAAVLWASSLGWLLWIPVSLFCIVAVSRYPFERDRIGRALVTAVLCMVVAVVARAAYVYEVNALVPLWYADRPTFQIVVLDSARNNFIMAGLVFGAAHAVHYAQAHAEGRLRIAQLERGLAQARLDALSAQLNPHFLFNALNTIAETVHHDPEAADAMIVNLSALLRQSLDRSGEHLIPLRDELQLLDHYLALQRRRLGARLSTEIRVAEACREVLVPRLLLQPLAENAIVHGIGRRMDGGRMELDIHAAEGRLSLSLTSDGPLTEPRDGGRGIGLENVRQRLEALFGAEGRCRIESIDGERTRVVVTQPLVAGAVA